MLNPARPPPNALGEAENLTVWRGERPIFHNLTFSIPSGGWTWVRGHNGSGKTTLLRTVAGLVRPSQGKVKRLTSTALLRSPAALFDQLSGQEHWSLFIALSFDRSSPMIADLDQHRNSWIPKPNQRASDLSSGLRQRLGLLRVLTSGTPLWLLDEPYSFLDSEGVALFERSLVKHLQRGHGAMMTCHQSPSEVPKPVQQIVLTSQAPSSPTRHP